ncbi:MAG TPA: pilin [Patescibacteria group bacterium]|nr:pilin [Patescibacteria group bacterium]
MNPPEPLTGLQNIFSNIVSIAIGLAGIGFFVMFVVGGFNYLTAGGDERKVQGARQTLTYAIGGLVLIALAYLILKLISDFTGITGILNFQIQQNP